MGLLLYVKRDYECCSKHNILMMMPATKDSAQSPRNDHFNTGFTTNDIKFCCHNFHFSLSFTSHGSVHFIVHTHTTYVYNINGSDMTFSSLLYHFFSRYICPLPLPVS